MTDEQVAALGPAFADYLRSFRPCFVTRDTFAHLGTYARGLLSDLPRKSVEPVALAAGCAVRTLQEFLTHHVWDHGRMRDELQRRVARDHLPAPGSRPAGGVGVVGWVRRDRRREEGRQDAGRPAAVLRRVGQGRQLRGHRPPRLPVWRVHGAARQRPVPARAHLGGPTAAAAAPPTSPTTSATAASGGSRWSRSTAPAATASASTGSPLDEWYGGKPGFLAGLDARGPLYACEVPPDLPCFASRPKYRSLQRPFAAKPVASACRFAKPLRGKPWKRVRLARKTMGDQVWEVRAAQVHLARDGRPTDRT
jgi:hypothetical protein